MPLFATTTLDKEFIASLVKPRDPHSHKGSHGHALLVAGGPGRMGAAVLSAKAALRTGVGLLTVNVPEEERVILQVTTPEAMLIMREDDNELQKYSAIGIGPAFGLIPENWAFIQRIVDIFPKPLVLDADALTLLSQHPDYFTAIPPGTILTPHPAEFDRLFGITADAETRRQKALERCNRHNWVIVLKGSPTTITTNGEQYTNSTGNAGLAKGGSGDVLTGMILALLAQGYTAANAACIGVFLHGLAADIAVQNESPESLVASDVIASIGKAFAVLRH